MKHESENTSDDKIEQALRLGDLRHRLTELNGGPLFEGGTENLPMDVQESFWKHVLHFETEKPVTYFQLLKDRAGFTPQPLSPQDSPTEVNKKLWRLINALASIRIYLDFTNHLSDQELYECLMTKMLPEATVPPPENSNCNSHIDVIEYGTKDEPYGYRAKYRYYSSDDIFGEWDYPDEEPPQTEEPAYNRDDSLPKADYG